MKITAVQDYLRVGGTEAQFLDLTARWSSGGHSVERLVFRRRGELSRKCGEPEPQYLQPFSLPCNWWAPGLSRRLLKTNPDLVICFGRNAHWSLARQLKGSHLPGLVSTLRTGRHLPEGYKQLLRASEAVVGNSRFAAKLAENAGVSSERIHVIENGCRFAEGIPPEREEMRKEFLIEKGDRVILCLGSFVPGKAQSRLLNLWDQIAGVRRESMRLWFVGDGPMRGELERKVRKREDADRFIFWGNRSDPEKFLAAADALVSVSREESSPNALVEALCLGVPVAATRCAGVEEIVPSSAAGFLAEDSSAGERSLADWLSASPEVWKERHRIAMENASAECRRFDPTARSNDYLELFQNLKPLKLGK